jgi:hypothetical protein
MNILKEIWHYILAVGVFLLIAVVLTAIVFIITLIIMGLVHIVPHTLGMIAFIIIYVIILCGIIKEIKLDLFGGR